MNAKPTAGPWTHKATASLGPQYAVYSESDQTGADIAIVYNNGSEAEANAQLIAAAPDLLEACEKVAELEASTRGKGLLDVSSVALQEAYRAVATAIQKARGAE